MELIFWAVLNVQLPSFFNITEAVFLRCSDENEDDLVKDF